MTCLKRNWKSKVHREGVSYLTHQSPLKVVPAPVRVVHELVAQKRWVVVKKGQVGRCSIN